MDPSMILMMNMCSIDHCRDLDPHFAAGVLPTLPSSQVGIGSQLLLQTAAAAAGLHQCIVGIGSQLLLQTAAAAAGLHQCIKYPLGIFDISP